MTAASTRALRTRLRALRDPVLVTRRLAFTLPDPSRLAELVRLLDDPVVERWTLHVPFPYRPRDARAWLRRAPARRRAGTDVTFSLVRRSDGALVGGVGLHHLDAEHARGELGYWIGRPFRRQGFATEAARATCGFAFRKLRLHRVEARVFPGNMASAGVLRAAGFRWEGRLRDGVVKHGRFRDERVYARLADDAPPLPRSSASTAPKAGRRGRRARPPTRPTTTAAPKGPPRRRRERSPA